MYLNTNNIRAVTHEIVRKLKVHILASYLERIKIDKTLPTKISLYKFIGIIILLNSLFSENTSNHIFSLKQ